MVEVGGVGTLPRSLRALKMGGVIAQIGVLTGPAEPFLCPSSCTSRCASRASTLARAATLKR